MTGTSWFTSLYTCCGARWEMTIKQVGPDNCPTCNRQVEPEFFYEEKELFEDDLDGLQQDDDAMMNDMFKMGGWGGW